LNIEDYTMKLPRGLHRLTPDGIHPNGYNDAWRNFFEQFPNAKADQILQFLNQIERQFGISPTQGF
jgi:hypothetical protein